MVGEIFDFGEDIEVEVGLEEEEEEAERSEAELKRSEAERSFEGSGRRSCGAQRSLLNC